MRHTKYIKSNGLNSGSPDYKLYFNENHFVNFTGATFALATHVYTSMHKSRLHQQVCRGTWKSILSQIFFNEKNL